ncbi:oxidoreductase, NAD-binding domain protein [Bacteriovorax sp. BSW11_IV]|uniref:Gfo/Idh/MocA family protein n=1 Tax=Bacteriovorax sp. BSW11_IV TaxID=1353529 RepID=UPI00038A3B3C|nr:Gfo/Idh/MocA family oxidoreductase [Bacteriovorax sp. BSW11_IV]EQC48961.1 oxidoreductase, NAD-binding domain protein [Bacteriovorax sp. BSW11_IV]
MSKVKVAVIGYGHLGKWHADKAFSLEQSELVAIVEKMETNQLVAKEKFPQVNVVSDYNEIINDFDAAIIVTPTSFHFDLVIDLLKKGKHVFCEKPMTSTYEQSLEVAKLLEGKDLVFQVGHSERCHQVWDFKKDFLEFFSGPSSVRINRYAPFKGRATDVDVIQDLMIHDIDLMLYLFGETPQSVTSSGYKIRTDKWDHVTSRFKFSDGKVIDITVGRNAVKEVREVEITSNSGALCFDLFANKLIIAKGSETVDFVKEVPYDRRDHLLLEQQYFYESIISGKPIFVDIHAGVNAMNVIEKVNKSLESGKEVFFS